MNTEQRPKTKDQKPKTKAIFIDRDGTLIEEVNYLSRVEDLRFFPFTDEAILLLKKAGFLIVVVTNQSGIGRGKFDEQAMHAIHEKIQNELTEKLDGYYFCPHLPTANCACRKPNTGMIETAMRDLTIDRDESWIIGDKASDVEAGFNAHIKTALVLTGYGAAAAAKLARKPDLTAENLLAAAREIAG